MNIDLFWSRVTRRPGGECWVWGGVLDKDGYGVFKIAGRSRKAHRVAYELEYGPLSSGVLLMHKCDNRACVRPDHLEPGTPKTNAMDRAQKMRSARLLGATNGRARLTADEVLRIRETWQAGGQTYKALGRQYGVSNVLIRKIVNREVWKHI